MYVNGKMMDRKVHYDSFVGLKKTIAVFLVPALIVMAAYNLFKWSNSLFNQFPTSYMNRQRFSLTAYNLVFKR